VRVAFQHIVGLVVAIGRGAVGLRAEEERPRLLCRPNTERDRETEREKRERERERGERSG
jgi:hypothetical protein